MSNSGHGKTVETMCEQLEINPVKQTVPHCFILMPVVIGLQLGAETYHLDSEMWKRQVKRNFGVCKALRSLASGVEILEVGADKLYYQVGGQINVLFK